MPILLGGKALKLRTGPGVPTTACTVDYHPSGSIHSHCMQELAHSEPCVLKLGQCQRYDSECHLRRLSQQLVVKAADPCTRKRRISIHPLRSGALQETNARFTQRYRMLEPAHATNTSGRRCIGMEKVARDRLMERSPTSTANKRGCWLCCDV